MKTAKDYLSEANQSVPRISSEDAIAAHQAGGGVFIDVRDSAAIVGTGTVAGALRIPRGLIEFAADASTPMHHASLTHDADIYIICAAGGQAALAGKTMQDMGYTSVTNIGGIGDWKAAGGPTEE